MKAIRMYRFERSPGKVTVSFEKPSDRDSVEVFRLIADEGKAITNNGVDFHSCLDVENAIGFYEVELPESEVSE